MATTKTTVQDAPANLVESFAEFKETKNIDRATLVSVLEECFRSVIARTYGTDENYDIIVNPDKGDFEIYRNRTVVEDGDVKDSNMEIALSEARKIEEDYEVGEEVSQLVKFTDFGRRAILTLRQTLASRILELEHDTLYNQYKDKEGELISAEVYQTWKRETLLLDDDGNELLLPRTEQISKDFFRKGENARAIIQKVENTNGKPKITLSRTAPDFLKRLLELEVPEIQDGLITIHEVARIPGERAKIAVESYDDRIDPVGACVGVKGSRLQSVVRELKGENIDVIPWTANKQLLIARALNPATVSSIILNEENRKAEVYLNPDQVSKAIGKNGQNIKLACMLTGYTIDVYRELDGEDVSLEDFKDAIDDWIIDLLKEKGMNTARDVLNYGRERLIEDTDLEEETIDEILDIMNEEFEDVDEEEEEEEETEDENTENTEA